MANWKKIVTESAPDTISQSTIGDAAGLVSGVTLGLAQGGTGQDLTDSDSSLGILYRSGDVIEVGDTPTTGQVLGNNNGTPIWTNPNESHSHSQYVQQEGTANLLGNVAINGTLSCSSLNVLNWNLGTSSDTYFHLNYNSGGSPAFGTGNHYGFKANDEDTKWHNMVYEVDASDASEGRWKIGSGDSVGGNENLENLSVCMEIAQDTMTSSHAAGNVGDIMIEGTDTLWVCTA